LERETGVTNKTAGRMFKQTRKMLEENHEPLSARAEVAAEKQTFGVRRLVAAFDREL